MNIKMTIEVSTEVAAKVIELLAQQGVTAGGMALADPITPSVPVQNTPGYQAPVNYSVPVQTAPVVQAPTVPAPTVPVMQQPTAAPTSAPAYTIEQFQTALTPLLDSGKVAQVQQLVQSFGVNTLMDIPPQRYGEFANGLRQLGGVL